MPSCWWPGGGASGDVIVGKTRELASFRRNRWLLTAVLFVYFIYTFAPIFYLITASTKTNPDLFTTFGLWFSPRLSPGSEPARSLRPETAVGVFRLWLWSSFYYATFSAVGSAVVATLAGYAFAKYDFLGKRFPLCAGARRGDDPADGAGDPAVLAPERGRPAQQRPGR